MGRRFTAAARSCLRRADEEARRHGDHRIGTDHVLLGLLAAPGSLTSRTLDRDVVTARAAVEGLDAAAMRAVGVVPPDAMVLPVVRPTRGHLSLTSGARGILVKALTSATVERSRTIEERHLLLALLDCSAPDPASDLLDAMGVERAAVRLRLRPAA